MGLWNFEAGTYPDLTAWDWGSLRASKDVYVCTEGCLLDRSICFILGLRLNGRCFLQCTVEELVLEVGYCLVEIYSTGASSSTLCSYWLVLLSPTLVVWLYIPKVSWVVQMEIVIWLYMVNNSNICSLTLVLTVESPYVHVPYW